MPMRYLLVGLFSLLIPGLALAQSSQPAAEPSDAAKALVGAWELSNPDRDRRCQITFKLDPAPPGWSITLAPGCAAAFPDLRPTTAWTMARDDTLKLLDAKGTTLTELNEVENGMYETTPSFTHYFLQNLAATGKERITDDLFGDWQLSRSGKSICQFTLGNTAFNADSFTLILKSGCDALITRFGPVAWRFDRGQFVMLDAKGQSWRFEENEENTWSRIPAMRPPLTMTRLAPPVQ
jgi:protease inhibitor Inh